MKPPPWDSAFLVRMDFLRVELRNSFTSGAHQDLVSSLALKSQPNQLGSSPQVLKDEAWRFFSAIGLAVSSRL